MTKDEALDLALEALEWNMDYLPSQGRGTSMARDAITAIKQARALDKKAENARELGLDYEPEQKRPQNCGTGYCSCIECVMKPAPVQEPVSGVVLRDGFPTLLQDKHIKETDKRLYTTPPAAQRQWVGLTFGEICEAEVIATDEHNNFSLLTFARAIEAELKEKNT